MNPVVFTNGVFDVLHVGHLSVLETCAELKQELEAQLLRHVEVVVGLNSDKGVHRLKGPTRPFNTEDDRKRMLLSFRQVDRVEVFDEDTPRRLLNVIRPMVIVKGGDYSMEQVVSSEGARVVLVPFVPGQSTTSILACLR